MARIDLLFSRVRKRATWIVGTATVCSIVFLCYTKSLKARIKELEEFQNTFFRSSNSALKKDDLRKKSNEIELQKLYKHYETSGQLGSLNALDFNNTRLAESQMLIFNRVPKVGSVMFMNLLEMLGERNNFTGYKDTPQLAAHVFLDKESQEKMASILSAIPTPAAYSKHLCYINFTQFGLPKPIYINMVRNPIERVVSWFYYVRAPWYYLQRRQQFPDTPPPDIKWIRMDFESCVLEKNSECNYLEGEKSNRDHRLQSLFFCGHDEECRAFNSKTAFERAKHTVETEYSVVGVLEDLETTLAVFEKYIPRFFAGATQIYNENKEHFMNINRNSFKPPVSEEIKNIVRKNFTRELEFFEFCKNRLYTQFIAGNLDKN